MRQPPAILTITGSDSTGAAGIQADVKTITTLGGYAMTAITAVTVQSSHAIHDVHDLPSSIVIGQVQAVMADVCPRAIKVGLVRSADTLSLLAHELSGRSNIVCDPGFTSSRGEQLASMSVVRAFANSIFPHTRILFLKCTDAEKLLNCRVQSMSEMKSSLLRLSEFGPEAILLQGGHEDDTSITNMLYIASQSSFHYFSQPNTGNWNLHGIGGTLSSAVATFLAHGETIVNAVSQAYEYIQSFVVYSLTSDSLLPATGTTANDSLSGRKVELYNAFMSLIAAHYRTNRNVTFYADRLNITTRYLLQVTTRITGKTPKQLIGDYLTLEAERTLTTTNLSIKEISLRFGFTSQAQFCKFFTEFKGHSPRESRQKKGPHS